MGWLSKLFGETLEAPSDTSVVSRVSNKAITRERIEFHIRRYDLALEQCLKGGDRVNQLRKGREYWITLRSAHDMEAEL